MAELEEKKSFPAIALRGIVPLPHNDFRTEVGRKNSVYALDLAEKEYNNEIILILQKDPLVIDTKASDVEKIGVRAHIDSKLSLPNSNYRVKFTVLERIVLEDISEPDPCFMVTYTNMVPPTESLEEQAALVRTVIDEITKNRFILNAPEDVMRQISSGLTSEDCIDIIAGHLKTTTNKYRYLSEPSLAKRMQYIIEDINREKAISKIEDKINEDVKKSIDESQKEYYLREKMKAIQSELGESGKTEEEIDELKQKIDNAGMPQKIHDKAIKELKRYQMTSVQMAESGVIRQYLDFIVSLPWKEETKDSDNIKAVKDILDKNHYGLEKVKERILEYLSVRILTGKNPQTILCLYGPPGVGKTTLAKSIAEALGRKFIKVSLGGVSDESEIRGHRRTYIGALPGRILKGMQDAGTTNPVFLLDEIDKMSSNYRGDPASAMLEVLDPEQNANFSDNYLEENYDLSKVLFVTTANSLDSIPGPLFDRMELIELSSYTEYEKTKIGYDYLVPKVLDQNGLDPKKFSITEEAMHLMIQNYTREAGVRSLQRNVATLVRKSIKEILMDGVDKVEINKDNLTKYLGKQMFFNNENREESMVGVVTGLAWTQFGGDTLDIEVTTYTGKGGLVLTGKLGDVMKESAMAALSYVKSHAKEYNIDPKIFADTDIHIHIPEGATPKDGPSAGVTLTTAIMSALTGRAVDAHLGMTGEVTLRGTVLPIGGLREKSIAAVRSGLKTILIPRENERDLDEVPQEVKDVLNIIPVHNVSEVLDIALK
ncbi:MAG: endopeptidase La [Acholeplasmatales bacterium]|nr:endopeptidase La [Acholeplasmatales bacterium]